MNRRARGKDVARAPRSVRGRRVVSGEDGRLRDEEPTAAREAEGTAGVAAAAGRSPFIGRWGWIVGAALLVACLGGGLVAYFSPALSVRRVEVAGVVALDPDEVRTVLGVAFGTPLMQVDTTAAAARVAELRRVASARVQREYPSVLRVTVRERTAVVFVERPDGMHLYDADGVDFAVEPPPPGLVRLEIRRPRGVPVPDGVPGEDLREALTVVEALTPGVRGQVVTAEVWSPSDVRLVLGDGRSVRWGSAVDNVRKARVVELLLGQPGTVLDVSNPRLATWS